MKEATLTDALELGFNVIEGEKRTKLKSKKSKSYDDAVLYRGMTYNKNVNKDTKKTPLNYKNKIGYDLKGEITEILQRRNQTVLVVANAGGGKTYVTLQVASELVEANEKNNVAYILSVPTTSQSNQNEVGDDLVEFGFESVVGKGSKLVGKDDKETITDKVKRGVRKYSCVFDTTYKVVEELKKEGLEVVLVVDEAHKLIWDTYREDALNGLDKSMIEADMIMMMTATPRTCLKYYKYDEIFELTDTDLKNNINEFKVRFTNNWELTLRKHIREIKKAGKVSLIRLNNKELIKSLKKSLEKQGYIVEVLTSNNKDGYIFKTIEQDGYIGADVDIVFCTSVVECGISLKDPDIIPIEIIREFRDFNSDNTIQFFARPRKQVLGGIMIIKNYQENLGEIVKALKEKRSKNKDKEIHASVRQLCSDEKYFREINNEINEDYRYLQLALNKAVEVRGNIYAREFISNEIKYRDRHKVIEFDEANLKIYINAKKVIQRAFKVMDEFIITSSPLLLETFFKESIFYGSVDVDVDNGEEVNEDDIKGAKEAKEERKKMVEDSKAQEEMYKEWLLDENFVKAIPSIADGTLNRANIKNYNLDISLRDIIAFKDSTLFELILELSNSFTLEETIKIITSKYKKSGAYIEKSIARDILERKHTIERVRTTGYIAGSESKYDTICEIVQYLKTKNGGKYGVQIRFTDELKTIIHCELVRKKGIKNYNHKKTMDILNDIDPYRLDFDWKQFYTEENIKKLDLAMSSQLKNKIINEVNKIYSVDTICKYGKEYLVINAPRKSFKLDSVLNDILESK